MEKILAEPSLAEMQRFSVESVFQFYSGEGRAYLAVFICGAGVPFLAVKMTN